MIIFPKLKRLELQNQQFNIFQQLILEHDSC